MIKSYGFYDCYLSVDLALGNITFDIDIIDKNNFNIKKKYFIHIGTRIIVYCNTMSVKH